MGVQVSRSIYTEIPEKIIYNQYRADLREIIRTLYKYKGVEILEGNMMPDHVHLIISIPPKMSVSSFMGYLKGKSALMMFDKHANLKYKFGNRHFWSEGYYVATVGMNVATIKKYIEEQDKHDIAMDKLSVSSVTPPFSSALAVAMGGITRRFFRDRPWMAIDSNNRGIDKSSLLK